MIKAVLSSLRVQGCAMMAGMYRVLKLCLAYSGAKAWGLWMCIRVACSVPSAVHGDGLSHCTTSVAQQIVPVVKKRVFNQWQLLRDFSERGAKHTPASIPTSVFSPQFILPALFLTCQSYWENKISN